MKGNNSDAEIIRAAMTPITILDETFYLVAIKKTNSEQLCH
ncbi:hypothetical protein J2X61_001154 [Bacillus sp. 3255]|nr:hypothetical protein [Bacillus sp. 3255]